jgi:hypothetical protein
MLIISCEYPTDRILRRGLLNPLALSLPLITLGNLNFVKVPNREAVCRTFASGDVCRENNQQQLQGTGFDSGSWTACSVRWCENNNNNNNKKLLY